MTAGGRTLGIYCPVVSARCPSAKCAAERKRTGDFTCPRTAPERRAVITKAAHDRREAEALQRCHERMFEQCQPQSKPSPPTHTEPAKTPP